MKKNNNLPGFTSENSTYKTMSHFRSAVTSIFKSGKTNHQVLLQKPNSENIPGGKCHATTSNGSINQGTYRSDGWCCGPNENFCINCSATDNSCTDGHNTIKSRRQLYSIPFNGFVRYN